MAKFIVTVRSVSGDTFGGDLGSRVRYLVVPNGQSPLPSQEIGFKAWAKQVMATFSPNPQGATQRDLLLYVHGFNEDIAAVAGAHGEIATGLASNNFECTTISFDWPSQGIPFAYLEDASQAKISAVDLVNSCVKPMLASQADDCRIAIHVLCHSMGAYVVREALDHADDGSKTATNWTLNQLVVIAGDVEAADFVDGDKNTDSMLLHCYRLTNYFNLYDEVLQISNAKRLGVAPRLGRVGLPANAPQKTVNIDCSSWFEITYGAEGLDPIARAELSHSWYFGDARFYADLAATLRGTVDRTVAASRGVGVGRTLTLSA